MIITKLEIKVLKYVYSKKVVSFAQLSKHFSKLPELKDMLEQLVYHSYLEQVGGYRTNYGEPVPITDATSFRIRPDGAALVESKQWFNAEYILSHICIPILLSIISTLITLCLSHVL